MKVIILTGISKGIGKAIFSNLSNQFEVIGISRNLSENKKSKRKLKIECDLSKLLDVEQLDLSFIEPNNQIIFINNAAIIEPIAINGTIKRESIEKIYNTNVIAPIILIQKILNLSNPERIKIINITSGAAKKPLPGWSLYSSSKAAVEIYLEALLLEYPNIKIINYDPGVVDTNMQMNIRSKKVYEFPLVERFKEFKYENYLRDTEVVAKEIIELI